MTQEKETTAIVIPFGKYKGRTVDEVRDADPQYLEWITTQSWLAEKFGEIHDAIVNRGTASDDTPAHNALQVRFLDDWFSAAVVKLILLPVLRSTFQLKRDEWRKVMDSMLTFGRNLNRSEMDQAKKLEGEEKEIMRLRDVAESSLSATYSLSIYDPLFENRGRDVIIRYGILHSNHTYRGELAIEIKPALGDDYPTVMRDMKRLKCPVVLVDQYTGRGVSVPQLKQMFEANGQALVFLNEVEAKMSEMRGVKKTRKSRAKPKPS